MTDDPFTTTPLTRRRRSRWLGTSAAAVALAIAGFVTLTWAPDDDPRAITDTPSSTTWTTQPTSTTASDPGLGAIDVSGVVEPIELGEFRSVECLGSFGDSTWATSSFPLDQSEPTELLRMDPSTGEIEVAASVDEPSISDAARRGDVSGRIGGGCIAGNSDAFWALELQDYSRRTLHRLDPQSAVAVAAVDLPITHDIVRPGVTQLDYLINFGSMAISEDSVWVVTTQRRSAETTSTALHRIDAATNSVVATIEMGESPIVNGAFPRGDLIAVAPSGAVYLAAKTSPADATIWAIDSVTNSTAGSVSVNGVVSQLLASDEAVWAVVQTAEGEPGTGSDRENLVRIDQSMTIPPALSFPDAPRLNPGGAVLLNEVLLVAGEGGYVYRVNALSGEPEATFDLGELGFSIRGLPNEVTMVAVNDWVWVHRIGPVGELENGLGVQSSNVWRAPLGAFLESE